PRSLNMNRLGAILTGEADPPVYSLFVYNANPVASTPNAGKIVDGLLRDDLFTVVHELFETDTARHADILLPATSQLEHVDLHKPYGHVSLQYNMPAIAPQGEARSNWDVMRSLASAMGLNEYWLTKDVILFLVKSLNEKQGRSEKQHKLQLPVFLFCARQRTTLSVRPLAIKSD